jgi:hypothetical protein
MSTPTPGSDPDYPQGGAPQGQPGWGAPQQPAQGYGAPAPNWSSEPAGYGGAGPQRPGQVTAAAVIGIVIGGLSTLIYLLALITIGTYFSFDAFLGILVLLSLAAGVVVLVGGIQALQGKSPRLLLLGSYTSIVVSLLYLVWAAISGWGFDFSSLLSFVLPGLIVFLLLQPTAKQYYASRGIGY